AAWKMKPVEAEAAAAKAAAEKAAKTPAIDPMDAAMKLDDLMLEVGIGLVPLVDAKQGGQLLARVKSLRKNLAQQLGFLVPSIDIPGQETREPAFDSPAKWITPDVQAQAIAAGYAVVDHTSVLAAHLAELIK